MYTVKWKDKNKKECSKIFESWYDAVDFLSTLVDGWGYITSD